MAKRVVKKAVPKKTHYMAQAIRRGIVRQRYVYSKSKKSAYHWSYVLIPTNLSKCEKIAQGMEKAVKCGKISYSNDSKTNAALYDAVKNLGFDCSKLKKKTTTNCCNLVSVACNYAGLKTPRKSSARTMASKWKPYGFKCCRFTGKHLKRGYILVDCTEPSVHTAVYMG